MHQESNVKGELVPRLPDGSVSDATIRAIAREASADERSVLRRLVGLPVRGLARGRIDRVIGR